MESDELLNEYIIITQKLAEEMIEQIRVKSPYHAHRIARDFQTNGLQLSKQTMSNWTIWTAERYFQPVYDWMKKRQLEAHVNQCDETTVEVIHDGRPAGSKSYMWVHLTGELSPGPKIVVYEYQRTRHSSHPKEYYKDFKGVLMTDRLEQTIP